MNVAAPAVGLTRLRPARLVVGIVVGLGALVAVVSAAGGLAEAADSLEHLDAAWIPLAVGGAVGRIVAYAWQLRSLDRGQGRRAGTALGLSLTVYGLGAVTPAAPAEGLVIAERELERRGRSRDHAVLVLGFSEWFAQRTFYVVAILALLLSLALGHVELVEVWPFLVIAAIVVVLLVVTARLAMRPGQARRTAAVIARVLRFARRRPVDADDVATWHAQAIAFVGPPSRRVPLALVSALAVLFDGIALWAACQAAGIDLPYPVVLLCAVAATMVTWVPLLPAGLGLVEAALPTLLHRFDVPLDDALAAALAYRAVGTLLPAAVGALAVIGLRVAPTDAVRTAA